MSTDSLITAHLLQNSTGTQIKIYKIYQISRSKKLIKCLLLLLCSRLVRQHLRKRIIKIFRLLFLTKMNGFWIISILFIMRTEANSVGYHRKENLQEEETILNKKKTRPNKNTSNSLQDFIYLSIPQTSNIISKNPYHQEIRNLK